jgi:hypothetical protein
VLGPALLLAFLLATAARGAGAQEPPHSLRLYNASANDQTITIRGRSQILTPLAIVDLDLDAGEFGALAVPADVVAVERLQSGDREADELHVLHRTDAAACSPSVAVRVPLAACRFGTAEAQVEPIPGATYQWTIEGGTILTGNGTPSVLLGFGGAFSAVARVSVMHEGCVSTGAAVLNLRDPLQATITVPDANVGTPVRLAWSYNTAEPILTQILQLPNGTAPIRLAPEVRSYVFTPAAEGTAMVKLTAALYRIGARRRAVRSGSGPHASSCSLVEIQRELRVRPPCRNPIARVSGGGTACGEAAIHAQFEGTPPFKGRWSDGTRFETSATAVDRTVTESGIYAIETFEDATCAGSSIGDARVTIEPETRLTAFTVTPQAIAVFSSATIAYSFENATSCRFTAGTLGNPISAQPSCSGTGSGSLTYVADNAAGTETMTLEVTGPCGTDDRTISFLVCDYNALVVAGGPTTFCEGGSVTLSVEIAGRNAGPPYGEYRFSRCTNTGPGACQYAWEYTLVQQGPSPTYVATQSGVYRAATEDRLGCPSVEGGSVKVTVNSCP